MTIIQCLRVYGPCSNVEIARHVGRDRERVYSAVYKLRQKGFVDRLGPGCYDLTDAGRVAFSSPPSCPLAKATDVDQLQFAWDEPL